MVSLNYFLLKPEEIAVQQFFWSVALRWNLQPNIKCSIISLSQLLISPNNDLFIPQIWNNNLSSVCSGPCVCLSSSGNKVIEDINPGFPVSKPWMKTECLHMWRTDISEFVPKPVKSKTSRSCGVKYNDVCFNRELDKLILDTNF